MTTEANCTFKVTSRDENPYQEFEGGAKLTRAKVSQAYQGDISGEGFVEFLMSHSTDDTASFVGMELVKGIVSGKSGVLPFSMSAPSIAVEHTALGPSCPGQVQGS